MESMVEALGRLTDSGYVDHCRAESAGLRFLECRELYVGDEIIVDEIVRFEGPSSSDDEAILFALHTTRDERKATYCSGYGAMIDEADSRVVSLLHNLFELPQ